LFTKCFSFRLSMCSSRIDVTQIYSVWNVSLSVIEWSFWSLKQICNTFFSFLQLGLLLFVERYAIQNPLRVMALRPCETGKFLLRLNETIITIIFAIKISENNCDETMKRLYNYNETIMTERRALNGTKAIGDRIWRI